MRKMYNKERKKCGRRWVMLSIDLEQAMPTASGAVVCCCIDVAPGAFSHSFETKRGEWETQ